MYNQAKYDPTLRSTNYKNSSPQFALLYLFYKFCLLDLDQYLLNTNDICL